MTDRPMTEETPEQIAQRVVDTWGDGNPPIVVVARALLSTSAAVRGMREVVEAAKNYVRCARPYSNLSPYIRENGRRGGSPWSELCDAVAVLSGIKTEQAQARLDGLASTPTDTKGTTK